MTTQSSARSTADAASADEPVVITDARMAQSDDIDMRQRRYVITMVVRTLCFVWMYLVRSQGIWLWVAMAGAAVLPGVAVVLANARDNRTHPQDLNPVDEAEVSVPRLAPGPVIRGTVVNDG